MTKRLPELQKENCPFCGAAAYQHHDPLCGFAEENIDGCSRLKAAYDFADHEPGPSAA